MGDRRRLAMHRLRRANHPPAKDLADTLMPQAHTERWDALPQLADDRIGDAGLTWGAGARRDDDMRRREPLGLLHRAFVVPPHQHLRAKLREILVQVVGEAVVVIDEQQHHFAPFGSYLARLCASASSI